MRNIFFTLLFLFLAGGYGYAQTEEHPWLQDLYYQILDEEKCEVGFYVTVQEYTLGEKIVQETRVQCVDGRHFDASRTLPEIKFKITLCKVQTCEAQL